MMTFLKALVRPRSTFENWTPDHRVTAALVVLTSVASVASVLVASETATTSASLLVRAAVAPPAWILLIGTLSLVVSGEGGGSDWDAVQGLATGCGVGAIAAVPGIGRAALRPIAVERALATGASGAQTVLDPGGIGWLAVVAITAVWSGAIVAGGCEAQGADSQFAAGVAVIAGLAIAASIVASPVLSGGLLGVVALAIGSGLVLTAKTVVAIKREFRLIGYRGGRGVEGAGWFVGLYRLAGLAAIALGFILVDGHLLA